jgi:hypothetical protein
MSELFRSEATGPTVRGCVWAAGELVVAERPELAAEIVAGTGDNAGLYAAIEACYRRHPDLRRPTVDPAELARRYLAERGERRLVGPGRPATIVEVEG